MIIGLVGQTCAGKSTVAGKLRRLGAHVFDADACVHGLYLLEDVKREVRTLFGDGVFDADGRIVRAAIGKIAFAEPEKLKTLTAEIIFPRTGEHINKLVESHSVPGAQPLVLDAPTLFESGRGGLCDVVIFLSAPLARRKAWAAGRGWPDGELERRDSRMMDEAVKRQKATVVVNNDGSLEELEGQIGTFWERLIRQ